MKRRDVIAGLAAATQVQSASGKGIAPKWPVHDKLEEQALLEVLRSGRWNRAGNVAKFEADYAQLMGSKHCLATANGTSALIIALQAAGVQAGDEVIVPPYTFVATVNAVLALHALPVFVDSDLETFQIDARKIEAAITPRTTAIVPVHLGGAAFDVDTVMATANKRGIPVIEDACQSHLAEWNGKRVGTFGAYGCFSFQASKNLNCGEGGAVLTGDAANLERCYAFHNNGRQRATPGYDFSYSSRGMNLRLTEFQAAILNAQMTRLESQARTRETNAQYLTKLLEEIPGIVPAKMYAGCTRNAYHLYMFRYTATARPRAEFLKQLAAEGISASPGYTPLNKEPLLKNTFATRGYKALFGDRTPSECPVNDRLCQEAVWLTQTMLLGPKSDMDTIAAAIRKAALA